MSAGESSSGARMSEGTGTGTFGSVELFYGKDSKGRDVSGKVRERWVPNMKRALLSSGLPKGSCGNKTLTCLRGDAAAHFEKQTPEETQCIGSEWIVFDKLKEKYPDKGKSDQKFEKLVILVTFRPKAGDDPPTLISDFKKAMEDFEENDMKMLTGSGSMGK